MKQRITIIEVAKKSGVAVSTVSRVLNGGYASPTVRSRVQSVVRQLGYVPSNKCPGSQTGPNWAVRICFLECLWYLGIRASSRNRGGAGGSLVKRGYRQFGVARDL